MLFRSLPLASLVRTYRALAFLGGAVHARASAWMANSASGSDENKVDDSIIGAIDFGDDWRELWKDEFAGNDNA